MSGRFVDASTMMPEFRVESIHRDQELVERLFALIVPAADARPSVAADGVDLIDIDETRDRLLRLLE